MKIFKDEINIYCDESCHLERDGINVMIIGGVWCSKDKVKEISKRISEIKVDNGISPFSEVKWTKISNIKEKLYMNLINYFFDDDDLHFRAIIVPDKKILDHSKFNHTHDDFYYIMYFDMLKTILKPSNTHNIYIDIKDKSSYIRSQKLKEVCCNSVYDFNQKIINKIQPIRSHESQLIQLADILVGAIGYSNRIFADNIQKSETKEKIISKIRERSGYKLTQSTLYKEEKLNLLRWESKKNGN